MIFVTLGTQHFQLDRLINEIDHLIKKGQLNADEVFIQNGSSKKSKYAHNYPMMDENKFNSLISDCDVLISHGGTSSIIKGLKAGKKVIVVPRKKKYKEHVDDHQMQIARVFQEKNYIIVIDEIDELEKALKKINEATFDIFESNAELANYLVEKYLED